MNRGLRPAAADHVPLTPVSSCLDAAEKDNCPDGDDEWALTWNIVDLLRAAPTEPVRRRLLPFMILRRLDVIVAQKKTEVLVEYQKI